MTTTSMSNNNMVIFCGGYDAEMVEIINTCRKAGIEVIDRHLGWGAAASAYSEEIAAAVSENKQVVLIELALDIELPKTAIVVDHHNEMSGQPASILQVLALLGMDATRWQQLVAANDCGYIPAMLSMGATPEEVAAVRLADRSAQGITPEQEAEAERALASSEQFACWSGKAMHADGLLTIVRMAHSKTATVADRLFNPEEEQRLLILSGDGESNFFGRKALCLSLQEKFGGWSGGGETTGYWGGDANQTEIEEFVKNFFSFTFPAGK